MDEKWVRLKGTKRRTGIKRGWVRDGRTGGGIDGDGEGTAEEAIAMQNERAARSERQVAQQQRR